jgi:glycosyltransferase involved in cell wall biosynthesis
VNDTPVRVSVVLITYNHEQFIAQAVESVLAQQTDFAVEILVTEDCSTDRTREVVRALGARAPDRIRLLLSQRNLNSNVVTSRAIDAARGEFIALLDGDDYWSVPDKLRTQVAFLDAHPECAFCFHDALVVYEDSDKASHHFVQSHHKGTSSLRDILRSNFVPGCSALIRRSALYPLPAWYEQAEYGDWPLYLLAARHGSIGYVDATMGIYRRHAAGYWSGRSSREQYAGLVSFFNRLATHFDARYRSDVRRARARWHATLAYALADEGDMRRAADEMFAALRDDPHPSSPAVRQRVRDLARFAGRSLFGPRRAVSARAGDSQR